MTPDAFAQALPDALDLAGALDADGDGASNGAELAAGSDPNDTASAPGAGGDRCDGPVTGDWNVCTYDAVYVLKKIHLDVCGQSPTRAQVDAVRAAGDAMPLLHAALDACLDSENWRGKDGVVWRMAHTKIRPVQSIKAGEEDPGDIPLGDYFDDYAYFVYHHTDDRDARDLLLGNYFVARTEGPDGTVYEPWDRSFREELDVRGFGPAQLVVRSARVGMLTHRWFIMSNTMFTAIPRTTAAQAYRAYLGLDISKLEGLEPGLPLPEDYDNKGVRADACAVCHTTLDPLTYPFTRYEGIVVGNFREQLPFAYSPNRMQHYVDTDGPRVAETPEAGRILGQDVANLREWAQVAANSDAFAQATVRDYWKVFMGEAPRDAEQAEFVALWQAFRGEHEYRVERMLHALIETEAYGVP
ncbi:MAG: hypothetical protein H6702_10325 [Myxococcales bacterium]|nr:hypothetical protein [Myxococcales bacterium]